MTDPRDPSPPPWWISLNVTRTRVTLLGFNLTLIVFMTSQMIAIHEEEVFTRALPAMSSLFVAFSLSMISAACLLASQELDEHGLSRPWLFSIGDLAMYLGLSQSAAGVLRRYLASIDTGVSALQEAHPAVGGTGSFLIYTLCTLGVLAWMFLMYIGPAIAMVRSPLKPREQRWLLVVYLTLLVVIYAVAAQAHILRDAGEVETRAGILVFLEQFLQPLDW